MTRKGFGPPRPPARKVSKSPAASKRQEAAKQLDDYKNQGLPLFTIYVRLPEKPDNWIPVGEIAVKRSSQITQALFANEADLLKGALRLHPKLSKVKDQLEYGYKLKGDLYADEPIQVATRPIPRWTDKLRANLLNWIQALQQRAKKN
ncbi:MAG: hypothetical protein OHK0012_26540 [Synechococcales cyanobacterium]